MKKTINHARLVFTPIFSVFFLFISYKRGIKFLIIFSLLYVIFASLEFIIRRRDLENLEKNPVFKSFLDYFHSALIFKEFIAFSLTGVINTIQIGEKLIIEAEFLFISVALFLIFILVFLYDVLVSFISILRKNSQGKELSSE